MSESCSRIHDGAGRSDSPPAARLERFGAAGPDVPCLVGFPCAGGSAAAFGGWSRAALGASGSLFDLVGVQYPGRGGRRGEPFAADFEGLVKSLTDALAPLLARRRVVFLGHSLGGLVAFEVAHRLRAQGLPGPLHLFIAARSAPGERGSALPPRGDRAALVAFLRRLGRLPEVVFTEPALLDDILPLLAADLDLLRTWQGRVRPQLDLPITTLAALEDGECPPAGMAGWAAQTRGAFAAEVFPGGHFFLDDARDAVLALVRAALARGVPVSSFVLEDARP